MEVWQSAGVQSQDGLSSVGMSGSHAVLNRGYVYTYSLISVAWSNDVCTVNVFRFNVELKHIVYFKHQLAVNHNLVIVNIRWAAGGAVMTQSDSFFSSSASTFKWEPFIDPFGGITSRLKLHKP